MKQKEPCTRAVPDRHLDRIHPFISLLKEGLNHGLLSRQAYSLIQRQILELLRDLIQRYTGSSSVKVETAEGFLNSIYFTLDMAIGEDRNFQFAYDMLQRQGAKAMYQKGIERIRRQFEEAKLICMRLMATKPDIDVICFQSTINEALPHFFRDYKMLYAAHENAADIDYPITCFDHEKQGIAYILEYTRKLELETIFINALDIGEVKRLLKAYGLMYRLNYRLTVMNLFEPLFFQCIFSVLASGKVESLILTASQYAYLKSEMEAWGEEKLHQRLMDGVERLYTELKLQNEDIKQYMASHLPSLESAIRNAMETASWHHLIVSDKEPNEPSGVMLATGETMGNDTFRALIAQIKATPSAQEKVMLIRDSCRNAKDFMDILEADCLWEGEYEELFHSLGDAELAVLCREGLWEIVREGSLTLLKTGSMDDSDDFSGWRRELAVVLCMMDEQRLECLDALIRDITILL
jgi:hypothetical protein